MEQLIFRTTLAVAIAACLAGLAYKVWSWLTVSIDEDDKQYTPSQRLVATLQELADVVFSPRVFTMLKALILDGFLQRRSLRHSYLAWGAHICVFTGFSGLLLLHALGSQIPARLFHDYYPTLEPWLMLRDVLGVMVMIGVALIIYRRVKLPGLRQINSRTDRIAIIFLVVVLLSGFALQALKITSGQAFQRMQEEYAGQNTPEEMLALRSVWAQDYGVVFPAGQISKDPQVLEQGRKLNEDSCVSCHSPAQGAFASYALSRLLTAPALTLDQMGAPQALYYLHFLAFFIGLGLLPFTKFLHAFSGTLLLASNAVLKHQSMRPAARAALRGMEMDACSHCGTCSVHCSVAVAMLRINNKEILPSERLASLSAMVRGNNGDREHLAQIREGAYTCTNCQRCTQLCPLGINLNDLWVALKKNLARAGMATPFQEVASRSQSAAEPSRHLEQVPVRLGGRFQKELGLASQSSSFNSCYKCQQCTNACPLVFLDSDPKARLDLLPHQVIHALGLGLKEEAMGARMVWNCLTCYQCQEACPNSVQVTDIFYELRNLSAKSAGVAEM